MIFKPLTEGTEWQWFKERTHVIACEDSQGIVAVDGGGDILAVCVADSFGPDNCNVHMAIDKPSVIKHGFLNEVARYVFEVCGCSHIFGLVPSNNEKALRFDQHIGFHEVARIPDGVCTGVDYVILRMNKSECRWLIRPDVEEAA